MPDNETSGPDAGERGIETSAIFALDYLVRDDYRAAVVSRVLNEFRNLPSSARNALKSAVNDTVSLPTGGFRRGRAGQALETMHTILQEPIEGEIRVSNKLATAVLRGWAESHTPLREEITRYLEGKGLDTNGPNLAQNRFHTVWEPKQWEAEWEEFTQAHEEFDRDDAGLMLSYVSGKLPFLEPGEKEISAVVSERLAAALACLRGLPPTAPEWTGVVPRFIESLSSLVDDKAAELRWADDFDAVLQSVKTEFAELLAFFEQDTETWGAARVSREADTAAALGSAERLRSLLAEYHPVHERAVGISEERERMRERDRLQPSILETAQEIDRLMTEEPGNPPYIPPPTLPERDVPVSETSKEPVAAQPPGVSAAEFAVLQSENQSLHDDTQALSSENQDLRDEVELLKAELYESQEMEESWRLAYLSSKGGVHDAIADTPREIESVNAAVEAAKERFKGQLTFAPNSESEIEGNPFIRPEKVWEALQWLATTYYKSKMGQLRVTNFDQSVKEACGWWYKGDQGETTMTRYRNSYTTHAHGRTYQLAEHIGKGTNFDARYTIRIAFNWDDGLRRVIVGYIGRHQQTDAS